MKYLRVIFFVCSVVLPAAAETRVRIDGMGGKEEKDVMDILGGRLTQVKASPASPSRANDAAFLLRKMLYMDGYRDVEVDWKVNGTDEIVLIVREGQRLKLGAVTIKGVAEDEASQLVKLFAVPAEKEMKLGGDPAPFREEDVETGLSYLRQEFNARGYWGAEASEVKRHIDSETGAVNLTVQVRKGKLYRISNPGVKSADGRGVKLVTGEIQPYAGKPATTKNVNEMRFGVEELVVSRGYPDADIRMSRELEPGRFVPEFSIDLGTRVRLGKIEVSGLERTHPKRVVRRLTSMEGEWYDEAAMNKKLRSFLATGAFSTVRMEKTESGPHQVDAMLHFTEAKAKEVTLGGGAGSYEGLIIRAGYADRNFMGKLLGFSAGFEYSGRGLLGDVTLTNPWLFGSDYSGTVKLFALSYSREGYDSLEGGLAGAVSRKFGDHYTVTLGGSVSAVEVTSKGLPEVWLGETSYQNPKIRLTQALDFRDNPVLPTKGWHLEGPLEFGASVADKSTSYFRAGFGTGWYHSINQKYQVGLGGKAGVLIPFGGSRNLPIDLRIFNGGAQTVRSFPERELGPRVNGYPTGGEAAWSVNAELMRSFGSAVKAVWFVDAGALDLRYQEIGTAEVELATGLGFRLDLPIGPVRFEYGYNLTKDPGEPTGTFHFAIGAAY